MDFALDLRSELGDPFQEALSQTLLLDVEFEGLAWIGELTEIEGGDALGQDGLVEERDRPQRFSVFPNGAVRGVPRPAPRFARSPGGPP
jgi:hypothetical protein